MKGGDNLVQVKRCSEHRNSLINFLREKDPNIQWNGSRLAKNLEEIRKCTCPECKRITMFISEIVKESSNNN